MKTKKIEDFVRFTSPKVSGKNHDTSCIPSAKLSPLTRMNNILKLFPDSTKYVELIKYKFTEYLVRLDNLYTACNNDKNKLWLSTHQENIVEFRSKIERLLYSTRSVRPTTTAFVKSNNSEASSTVSAAKVKLAEQFACAQANMAALEKEKKLKETEFFLKRKQMEDALKL